MKTAGEESGCSAGASCAKLLVGATPGCAFICASWSRSNTSRRSPAATDCASRIGLIDADAMPGVRRIAGLKDVETLRQEANLAGLNTHPAAQNGHPAATSPRQNGEVKKAASPSENGSRRGHLAAGNGKHIYVLRKEASGTDKKNGTGG